MVAAGAATSSWLEDEELGANASDLFSLRKPRDARAGCSSGLKSLLKGVLGGIASLCCLPVYGCVTESNALQQELDEEEKERKESSAKSAETKARSSARTGCAPGGACAGFAKGLAFGVLGCVILPVSGACVCCIQVTRGVLNTPSAISNWSKGKVWDREQRRWVPKPGNALVAVGDAGPSGVAYDERTGLRAAMPQDNYLATACDGEGGDVDYYEVLNVSRDATEGEIKRAYYHLARKYHPDKNKENENAHSRFQLLGEAYQVLSDREMRAKYDRHGKDALDVNFMDYACVFTILFGAEPFEGLIGELVLATVTSRGGDLDPKEMKEIQKARVAKLAANLADMLSSWVAGEREAFMMRMHEYGKELSECSFGDQLLAVISNVYRIQSKRALGGLKGFGARVEMQRQKFGSKMKVAGAAMRVMQAHFEIQKMNETEKRLAVEDAATSSSSTPEKKRKADEAAAGDKRKARMEEMALPLMMEAMWAANVVDIEETVASACREALGEKESRKERALGLAKLAEIFESSATRKEGGSPSGLTKAQDARDKLQQALFQFQQKKLDEEDLGS